MMRAIHRLRFEPISLIGGPTLIDRYLGRDDHVRHGGWTSAPDGSGLDDIEISLIDTAETTGSIAPPEGAARIWHVLWVREGANAHVTIDGESWTIAPGDTVIAAAGTSLLAEGGQLAIAIAVPGGNAAITPPTHGEDRFFGYNRQTICCRVGDLRLCRWKLTQPLALAEHHPQPALTLALARSSVVRTSTTVDYLTQGELAAIDPATAPIVTPDGLSYLLTLDRAPIAN